MPLNVINLLQKNKNKKMIDNIRKLELNLILE